MNEKLTLSAVECAELLGISTAQFRRAVHRGELPGPVFTGRPFRWSRKQILNRINDDEPEEDQFKSQQEELMARIRALKPEDIR